MTADEANYWLSRVDFDMEISVGCRYGQFELDLREHPALAKALRKSLQKIAAKGNPA